MLSEKLAHHFNSRTRERGAHYHHSGKVTMLPPQPDESIVATVMGSEPYTVTILTERSPRKLLLGAHCSCPYMLNYDGFCKHVWATILAIEDRPEFAVLPKRVRIEAIDDVYIDDLSDAEADSFEEDEFEGSVSPVHSLAREITRWAGSRDPREASRHKRPPPPPAWSRLLSELAARSEPRTTASRSDLGSIVPLYVLEPMDADANAGAPVILSLAHQTTLASGRPGKPKRLTLRATDIPNLPDQLDRHICLMLAGAAHDHQYYYPSYYYSDYGPTMSKWTIPERAVNTLFALLFETKRFHLRGPEGELVPLSWDDGEPWQFILSVESAAKASRYQMVGHLYRGDQTTPLHVDDQFIRGRPDLMIRRGVVSRLATSACPRWLQSFREVGALPIEASDRERFFGEVGRLQQCPPIRWPDEWGITEVADLAPRPELALSLPAATAAPTAKGSRRRNRWSNEISGQAAFYYGTARVDPRHPEHFLTDAKAMRRVTRQLDAEGRYWNRLLELGFRYDQFQDRLHLPGARLMGAVAALVKEGWTVLGDKKLFRPGGEFTLSVTTGIDWFELDGRMDFGGQTASLPALLEAARKGQQFVRLDDGSMGMLPEDWLARHGALLELGRVEDGQVRFTRTQVGLIDALLAQMPEATFDVHLAAARDRLHHFRGIQPRSAPAGFAGALRPYQEQGLAWLGFLNDFGWGGCLADDMGLGKTVQVLAMLLERKRKGDTGPSLIVLPKSIVFNWQREAATFAPELRVLDYTGNERREIRKDIVESDLVLTTYGTFKRDIDALREYEFNCAILDEAQAIKNPGSLNAKAARLLRARHRLVMTGTPVENRLGDLWSLFEFLNPGMLGSVQAFRGAFDNHRGAAEAPPNLDMLHRMLRPFILRRTKDQVAPELPSRSEQTIECTMSQEQADYYSELRDYYRKSLLGKIKKEGLARNKVYVLEALLRLRQAACHPALIDKDRRSAESTKMEMLLPMLAELVEENHKALVFSQFTTLLALLRDKLDRNGITYEYLDGQTRDRQQRVDRFQSDPKCPLFLISLKAGGTGLNLTAADYVFILDPWWNPAVEAQAIDRTHRIGQDKKVIAYRLITRDTVEAKILELQQRKRDLAGAIISEANSLIQDLTREDLELLLS